MKIDPILAVEDVEKSSKWYQTIFDCESKHGGNQFDVLVKDGDVMLCLHKWGEHEHPTMANSKLAPGNGLILYYRVENLEEIWQRIEKTGYPIEREIQPNPNSGMREFSIRDLDGYYLTISEFHTY